MMRSLRALAFCLILATVPLAGPAGTAAAEAEPSILSSDARLAKRVTLSAYRIHLGELLERLSAETGVPLATDERHSLISGRELAVVVHDRPAAEVLDAVARLYNFPPDRWYWAREKRGRRGLYVLHNTLSDAELMRRREEWELNTLLEEYHWKKGFLALPPGRRDLMAASNPALQGLNTSKYAGMFSFVGNLPENELVAILRGQPLSIPASAFSPAQRSALAADIAEGNTQRRQSFIHTEGQAEPLELRVEDLESVSLKRGDEVGGLPTLTFTMHMGNSQTITSLLGGWDLLGALREHTPDDWVATDETVTAEDQPVPPAGTRVHPADLQSEHNTADRLLEQLGQVSRLNLLYDRPVSRHSRFYITLKKSLEGRLPQVLSSIRNDFVMWKRWDDFLLFRLADWSVDHTRVPVPWPVIR
ncbi:MAG TPA: hypothetical protein VK689_01045, partial [Armatimonadota bacterium]|nr:hypothetical protein [Armatimonadota bacterium]